VIAPGPSSLARAGDRAGDRAGAELARAWSPGPSSAAAAVAARWSPSSRSSAWSASNRRPGELDRHGGGDDRRARVDQSQRWIVRPASPASGGVGACLASLGRCRSRAARRWTRGPQPFGRPRDALAAGRTLEVAAGARPNVFGPRVQRRAARWREHARSCPVERSGLNHLHPGGATAGRDSTKSAPPIGALGRALSPAFRSQLT